MINFCNDVEEKKILKFANKSEQKCTFVFKASFINSCNDNILSLNCITNSTCLNPIDIGKGFEILSEASGFK